MKKAGVFIIPIFLLFVLCAAAQTKVTVVPLGTISDIHVQHAVKLIKQYVPNVVILPKEKMPDMAYYTPRRRYRADKLIAWLHNRAGSNERYIGLTDKDISYTKGKTYDFGIMGLALLKGKGCVVSTFRLKNKDQFPKIAIHELAHTTGLNHCPTEGCYMMDAKGSDHTARLNDFCQRCKAHLRSKNWNIK